MSSAIDQLLAHLPEDQRTIAQQALNADFEKRVEQHLASQQFQSMTSPSSSSPGLVSPSSLGPFHSPFGRVKPQAPESFSGNRTKVEQFIIQLRRYLLLANLTTATIDNRRQVEYAAQYLSGEALVWFENVQKSDTPITSLSELETKLRAHFLPYGIEKVARTKLRQLIQTGSVQSYSTVFMQTILHVPNMHVDDKIEAYVQGLKSPIYKEVVLKDLKSLQEVMDFAAFVESRLHHRGHRDHIGYNTTVGVRPGPTVSTSSAANTSFTSVPMELSVAETEQELNALRLGSLKKLTDIERDQLRREGKCFRCRERGHLSRNCPKNQQSKNEKSQQ